MRNLLSFDFQFQFVLLEACQSCTCVKQKFAIYSLKAVTFGAGNVYDNINFPIEIRI